MLRVSMFSFWLFYAFLGQSVCFVPSPTNISVVCHNFVNLLYWNYSKPTEQLKFLVTVKPYTGSSQTFDTSQTYLDISENSRDADTDYLVNLRAYDAREESKDVSIKFTYSTDFLNENVHECSLDFPPVNIAVHEDVVNVFFPHPYSIYNHDNLLNDFIYKVTHDQQETKYNCFEDEELCSAEIHLHPSVDEKCVELKFEGINDVLFTTTYKNVCLSGMPFSLVDHPSYIAALVGGGVVILLIFVGFVWLLCKKWSKIPKIPEVLFGVMNSSQASTAIHHRIETAISSVTPTGHLPLLEPDDPEACNSPTLSPTEKDTTITPTDAEEVMVPETSETSEVDVNFEVSGNYGKSSDYDSPKFMQEMSPGDFTTGYGPRPPVL